MSRKKSLSSKRKIALAVSAAVVAGGGAFAFAANSNAAQSSTVCDGLNTALANNQKFIEGQRANPDAQSAARIANREAVIAQIQVQQKASGCEVTGGGDGQAAEPAAPSAPAEQTGGAGGEQVCNGSTVTLSGEGGAPAASSNQFPAGTKLKVTNLDNNKSTTVEVTSVSGSCVLLNNAAFEQVREPGKFLIRRAVIEKVG
ncbi:hypothetical protein ACIQNU_05850 [Streptomyces sp. NPDC091292]|uniref:hypothetical protein n=1 Tax=Streptomyces sp. NPDC091292 TaxID=3365991 RepID=UPI0038254272